MTSEPSEPGRSVRQLMRELPRAALGTLQADGGEPYVSLVMVAVDPTARPLLLLSDLADHTRNLRADPRVSLLFDATAGLESPLTGSRASVQGHIAVCDEPAALRRYLARHPDAETYAGFRDFNLYRIEVERAHLVAGFGRIHWMAAERILAAPMPELAGREADIVAHMNDDHADAVQLYARRLLGRAGEGWRMTGVDDEGADLRLGGETARLPFDTPVRNADECRVELVRLVKKARATGETAQG